MICIDKLARVDAFFMSYIMTFDFRIDFRIDDCKLIYGNK